MTENTTFESLSLLDGKIFDGKQCVLEMKNSGNRNWRQTEWPGFYLEQVYSRRLFPQLQTPGRKFGNTVFDFQTEQGISGDIKTHSTTSGKPLILNDRRAVDLLVENQGVFPIILYNILPEYDDTGEFKQWHDVLKGRKTAYVKRNQTRGVKSRVRKTAFSLQQIILVLVKPETMPLLSVMRQGRNSNGKARPEKYCLNLSKSFEKHYLYSAT